MWPNSRAQPRTWNRVRHDLLRLLQVLEDRPSSLLLGASPVSAGRFSLDALIEKRLLAWRRFAELRPQPPLLLVFTAKGLWELTASAAEFVGFISNSH